MQEKRIGSRGHIMKITKIYIVLLLGLIFTFLFKDECFSQYTQAKDIIKEADALFAKEEYSKAAAGYKEAFNMLEGALKEEKERDVSSREEKLERKENIIELRKILRELSIIKRKAELKDRVNRRKEEIKQKMKQQELKSTRKKIWEERFQLFVFLGLIFLVWEQLLSDRKKRKKVE